MKWIDSNNLSTDKNVVDVKEKDTIDIDVQCNLNVKVVKLIDLCILFVYSNEMVAIHDQFVFIIIYYYIFVRDINYIHY